MKGRNKKFKPGDLVEHIKTKEIEMVAVTLIHSFSSPTIIVVGVNVFFDAANYRRISPKKVKFKIK